MPNLKSFCCSFNILYNIRVILGEVRVCYRLYNTRLYLKKNHLFSLEENSLPKQRQPSEFSMKCAYDKVHIT